MTPVARGRGLRVFLGGVWLLSVLWSALLHAQQPLPALTARVTDLTGTLKPAERQQLESQLADLERRKGSQLVVVMVPSTLPEPISDYTIRLAESWKIGRAKEPGKKVDDGVILLVAKNDRKVRIEVGYGLEGAIPDALAKRIIVEAISPRFREGDYFGGIQAAVVDLTKIINGEPLPEPWRDAQKNPGGNGQVANNEFGLLGALLFVFVGGLIATAVLGRFLGSTAGAVGAGFLTMTSGFALPLAALAGVGAFVFLLVISGSRRGLSPVGRHTYRPGGVIFPGGWGGGGGGGGGGFSGGGGGFGGGGASGDW